ncbi:MAG: hypothetical protein HYY99_00720 [Candidatus Colwellbacteria bacterium]|nr:hypothetical protein [Candidatus Colwellbacteria bacterium]
MNEEPQRLIQTIKATIFDVDGVLTDNTVPFEREKGTRFRSYYDGQGTSLLRAVGIRLCFITNEKGENAAGIEDLVNKLNNLPSSRKGDNPNGWEHIKLYTGMGGDKKVVAAEEWLTEIGISFNECGFMGDDLVDLALMKKVAFRAAPISGEEVIRNMCHFVSTRPGGHGAIRDLANFILAARGIDPTTLPPQ